MCKYCGEYYTERTLIRNSFADDNLCLVLREDECEDCGGCAEDKNYFEMSYYGDFMVISHWREMKYAEIGMNAISAQNSERIERNFCHNCGRKLK